MQEYWKWPESCWTSGDIDWKSATRIVAGVDIGTTSSQAVIMCDGEVFGYANIRTTGDFKKTADAVIEKALGDSGMTLANIESIVSTGWGAHNATYAGKTMDEVTCHAKGGRFMYGPDVHTVLDMGGQITTAIRLYDWDRVWDFTMNDKCATGMGRAIEDICDMLQVPIEEIGEKSLDVVADPEPVSTTCHNFADSETMGQFRPEYKAAELTENEVYAAHLFANAWRILSVVGKLQPLDVGDIKVYEKLGFTGGLAKNEGIIKRIERELNTTALTSEYDPMLAGAIGAALLA